MRLMFGRPASERPRGLGNQAMQRLLQTKPTINQAGDRFEQQADQVAEQIMRMPDPAPAGCDDCPDPTPSIIR